MLRIVTSVFIFIFLIGHSAIAQQKKDKVKDKNEILLFYKTEGFWHRSIPTGISFMENLAEEQDFKITTTKDADDFLRKDLQKYKLIIFLNNTGDVFDQKQQKEFKKYIEKGGNFFGIHAAADTELDWPWFGELVGGFFDGHPKVQQANIKVNIPQHPTVNHLPKVWTRTDEWYNYKNLHPEMQVLLYLDENSYEGGTNGKEHPIAWFRETGFGGVSIYTGGGHTIQSYLEPVFQEHLLQCILFGLNGAK